MTLTAVCNNIFTPSKINLWIETVFDDRQTVTQNK